MQKSIPVLRKHIKEASMADLRVSLLVDIPYFRSVQTKQLVITVLITNNLSSVMLRKRCKMMWHILVLLIN